MSRRRGGTAASPRRRLVAALGLATGAVLLWVVLWQTGALGGQTPGGQIAGGQTAEDRVREDQARADQSAGSRSPGKQSPAAREGSASRQAGEGAAPAEAPGPAPASGTGDAAAAEPPPGAAGTVRELTVKVVATYPHDPTAFTQGLLLHGGRLFESTGRYGHSMVRELDLESGEVVRRRELPANLFGEGLALVPAAGGPRLVQLTWQEGRALVWDAATFEPRGEHTYGGEGWGLCYDAAGKRLVMSDGTPRLAFRDPESFAETGAVVVSLHGRPLGGLNELECVGGRVYANVFTTDFLVEIDPADGRVTALIRAANLLPGGERRVTDVLNGIAHDPRDGTFLLTGKLWPKLFRVELVPAR